MRTAVDFCAQKVDVLGIDTLISIEIAEYLVEDLRHPDAKRTELWRGNKR